MKAFKRLFGKSTNKNSSFPQGSSSEQAQQVTTLERLRELEELLKRKQIHLESRIEDEIKEARRHGMKNKRAALGALKRKKRVESELARLDGTLTTLEMQREALESAKNNLQVLRAMKDAANVLKAAQEHVTVDKVLDIMDDVNEQQEVAKEIADALANPLGATSNFVDDAELERELEELEQEELNKALLTVSPALASTGETKDPKVDGNKIAIDDFDFSIPAPTSGSTPEVLKIEEDPDAKELQELAQWSM